MRRGLRLGTCVLAGLALLATLQAGAAAGAQEGTVTLLSLGEETVSLLLFNPQDLSGVPELARGVDAARAEAERTLALYAGGRASGSGVPIARLSGARLDAAALGAAELRGGDAALGQAITESGFPLLAANLGLGEDSPLRMLFGGALRTTLDALHDGRHGGGLYELLIAEDGEFGVCAFGLVDPQLQPGGATFRLQNPIETAQSMVARCDEAGADLTVAMLHVADGVRLDRDLKAAVPGIDVVVLGGAAADPSESALDTERGPSLSVGVADPHALGRLDLGLTDGLIVDFNYAPVDPAAGVVTSSTTSERGGGGGFGPPVLMLVAGVVLLLGAWLLTR